MKHMTRLNKIERMRRRLQPQRDVYIYYDPETCSDGIEDVTYARNARTDEKILIADIPADALRVVVRYDRPAHT